MKLVIDIEQEFYEKACKTTMSLDGAMPIYQAIKEGTPLPKGHGRLIDADAELEGLRKMKVVDEKDKQSVRFAILEYENAQPVIEADYGEEEGDPE